VNKTNMRNPGIVVTGFAVGVLLQRLISNVPFTTTHVIDSIALLCVGIAITILFRKWQRS
jgi:hypothetical protein